MKTICSILLSLVLVLAFSSCSKSDDKSKLPSLKGLTFSDIVVEGEGTIAKIVATDLKTLLSKAGAVCDKNGRPLKLAVHSSRHKWEDGTYAGKERITVGVTVDFPEGSFTRGYYQATECATVDEVNLAYNAALNLVSNMPPVALPSEAP